MASSGSKRSYAALVMNDCFVDKWKPDVQHHRKTDDLGTGFEILE